MRSFGRRSYDLNLYHLFRRVRQERIASLPLPLCSSLRSRAWKATVVDFRPKQSVDWKKMGNEISNLSQMDELAACCTGTRNPREHHGGLHKEFTIPDPAQDRHRLFHLIESGQHMMLDAFLQRRHGMIDINGVNEKGETSLHMAARLGYLGCCKTLVANGADVTLRDWAGKTPVDVARQTGHNFCEAFLQARFESVKPHEERAQTVVPLNTTTERTHSETSTPREEYNKPEDTPAKVLYDYTASANPPFPPDKRMEFSIATGEKLVLLETRPDGWAIVRRKNGKKEGYVPGNYISIDGRHPLFDDHGRSTGAVGANAKKFKHLGGHHPTKHAEVTSHADGAHRHH